MKINLRVVKEYNIQRLLETARALLYEMGKNRGVRVRDISFSSADMLKFVEWGLVEIVATEREKREIPQKTRYGRTPDLSLKEVETGNVIEDIRQCRVGFTYVAKDTKTVDAIYHIYRLTFGSIEEVKYIIKEELKRIYNKI